MWVSLCGFIFLVEQWESMLFHLRLLHAPNTSASIVIFKKKTSPFVVGEQIFVLHLSNLFAF